MPEPDTLRHHGVLDHWLADAGDVVLVAGDECRNLLADARQRVPDVVIKSLPDPAQLLSWRDPCELVCIAGLRADDAIARPVIAFSRDVLASRVLLSVEFESHDAVKPVGQNAAWSLVELLGLGFKQLQKYRCESVTMGVFGFNITDYKKKPDWLSAEKWANPEMWNRYRW